MKNFLLLIGLTVFTFSAFAEKVPTVVVNKQQGGVTALLNLYNHVNYTPPELTATGIGQLDCYGSGFIACRVPNNVHLMVNEGNTVSPVSETSKVNALLSAVNDVIIQYETALEQNMESAIKPNASKGSSVPNVYTKTIAIGKSGGANVNKPETYVVRGVVTSSSANSSSMKIYIEKVNILSTLSNN